MRRGLGAGLPALALLLGAVILGSCRARDHTAGGKPAGERPAPAGSGSGRDGFFPERKPHAPEPPPAEPLSAERPPAPALEPASPPASDAPRPPQAKGEPLAKAAAKISNPDDEPDLAAALAILSTKPGESGPGPQTTTTRGGPESPAAPAAPPAPPAASPAVTAAPPVTAPAAITPPPGTATAPAAPAPPAPPSTAPAATAPPAPTATAAAATAPPAATPVATAPPPPAPPLVTVAASPAPSPALKPTQPAAGPAAGPVLASPAVGPLLALANAPPLTQVQPGQAPPGPSTPAPLTAQAPQVTKTKPPRPAGKSVFYTFFHKNADSFLRFLGDQFQDLVEKGNVAPIEGKPRTVVFFGDDPTIALLTSLANEFDDLDLKLERQVIRPKFVDVAVAMEALNMAAVANVWNRVEENVTTNVLGPDGKVQKTFTHKQNVYAKGGLANGNAAPANLPAKVPYIFEMPWTEPFQMPRVTTGRGANDQTTIDFNNSSSTEKRGAMVAVGTAEDLERIQAFVEQVDRPARLIMIEVQLVELDASKFSDIGLDSFQGGGGHTITTGGLSFPGEPIPQPGIPTARAPNVIVPPNVASGITGMFDDTSVDLSGRFIATIHALVRTGDAKVKARPKILALDDRPSILHIGEEIPTFESTGVSRELTGGNFVEQVNRVTTQYVGFTLNMRPRISGENEDEVSLQLEVVSNKLQGREQVFAQDLLGIPSVTRRRFLGQTRVRNHRPIILGGLIQEEESESVNKLPVIGDVPVLKYLFSRRQKTDRRVEVILILTPHILSDKAPDRVATPKESVHFDTFDSVLFNDRHIIKGRDVQGIDPITKQPAKSADGKPFSESEVIDLTLLKIVKERKLVSKLGIFDEYLPVESAKLGWLQRKFPERSVRYWKPEKQDVYFKAAAIIIENIKELNPDLTYRDLVTPAREIVLPTTPYRMTLSFDNIKVLKERGQEVLRGERVELSPATVEILKEAASSRSFKEFADFVEKAGIKEENHGQLRAELERLRKKLHPERPDIAARSYPEFLRKLADQQIDFMVLATYFEENLAERYATTGAPNIGTLEKDLVAFLKSLVSISQRAKRLRALDTRWSAVYSDEPDEKGPPAPQPESPAAPGGAGKGER
jgi:Flp pilus assembly secretin CpaC